jgi:hypothetical protein
MSLADSQRESGMARRELEALTQHAQRDSADADATRAAVAALSADVERERAAKEQALEETARLRSEFDALKADVDRSKASYDELFAEFEKADAAQKSAAEALAAATERADKAESAIADANERARQAELAVEAERERAQQADVAAEAERERSAKAEKALLAGATTAHADLQKRLEAASARVRELELKLFGREQTAPEGHDLDLGSMLEDAAPAEQPIRRFERYSFPSKIEARFDEYDAQLVDLSVGGAQILSAIAFELFREAPIALVSDEIPVACRAKVMWTRADPQSQGKTLRYRAGVQFIDADPAAVEAFIIRYSDINLYKRRQ